MKRIQTRRKYAHRKPTKKGGSPFTKKHSRQTTKHHPNLNHYKGHHYQTQFSKHRFLPHPPFHQRSQSQDTAMACAPITTGQNINKHTCYTLSTLNKIKYYYNKTHPTKKIHETLPNKLWAALKTHLTQCNGKPEDCWLETISDKKLKNEIDDAIFAPDAPPQWTKNPNEWLSNYDISKVLKQYEDAFPEFEYIDPSPIDFDSKPKEMNGSCVTEILCKFSLEDIMAKGKTKIGFVFNLDKHNQSGSHWVSMFLDLEDKYIFYFDSTGDNIPKEISILKDRIIQQANTNHIVLEFYNNNSVKHQRGNTECGIFSLFFIITLLTFPTKKQTNQSKQPRLGENKKHYDEIATKDLPKIKLFLTDNAIPDEWVQHYRHYFFNIQKQKTN